MSLKDRTRPARFATRLSEIIVGSITIALGFGMLYALLLITRLPTVDVWQAIGVSVGVFLYSCVVELLVLGGLQLLVGESSKIKVMIDRSKWILYAGMFATSCLIAMITLLILIL